MSKPIVHYNQSFKAIVVGEAAMVQPIDHYATDRVSNTKPVFTSKVVSYDKSSGEFETMNTKYVFVEGTLS